MACKRCPLRRLLTPFWSPIKHLLLYGFITIWFSVGCRVALELGFCMLFKVICLRECNVFSGWGNASRQVNELLAKKDRIIERQSNKWTRFFWVTKLRVDKLTSGQVNELFVLICWPMHSKTRHKNVLMLLCLLFTLSTSNLSTRSLVHLLCYSVFYLLSLQATC